MGWNLDDDPDTLIYREEVRRWMDDHWGEDPHPCPVCGADSWLAEGRLFMISRVPPFVGLFRGAFPVTCTACAYMRFFNARIARISLEPVFPDDLGDLDGDPEGSEEQ